MQAKMTNNHVIKLIQHKQLADKETTNNWILESKKNNLSIFDYIVQNNLTCPYQFAQVAAEYFHLKYKKLDKPINDYSVKTLGNTTDLVHQLILVEDINASQINLYIANPEYINSLNNIELKVNKQISVVISPYPMLFKLFNQVLSAQLRKTLKSNNTVLTAQQIATITLSSAIHLNASDIHFEPMQDELKIRFRIDGLLQNYITISNILNVNIINYLKVMAKIDISMKHFPQDGRFSMHSNLGLYKEARVSTYPVINGEKMVIRLLDNEKMIRKIQNIGLSNTSLSALEKAIGKPQGLILVTGPTGSGKSMTLYSLIQKCQKSCHNITTIEDPIEIKIPGINQSSINPAINFTFASGLRALLRQDPDIIMIGEIRDRETAKIALYAAQTGHLVLSTLHTNNAIETINRLLNMELPAYQLLSSSLTIIEQRLLRRLCQYCKILKTEPIVVDNNIYTESHHAPQGCSYCTDGYSGRIGVFGIYQTNRYAKSAEVDTNNLYQYFNTVSTIKESCLGHLKKGTTSIAEIYRVVPFD